mmetsp:Transcript_11692/g.20056  ORF Transcript_11692/g.20056 Transcript_11692/m.20056 type:complete len:203 (+) Transcript_11692:294-902(+)
MEYLVPIRSTGYNLVSFPVNYLAIFGFLLVDDQILVIKWIIMRNGVRLVSRAVQGEFVLFGQGGLAIRAWLDRLCQCGDGEFHSSERFVHPNSAQARDILVTGGRGARGARRSRRSRRRLILIRLTQMNGWTCSCIQDIKDLEYLRHQIGTEEHNICNALKVHGIYQECYCESHGRSRRTQFCQLEQENPAVQISLPIGDAG